MFDKNMFEKICKLKCSIDELKSFNKSISRKEFDLDNPFEKYYALDTILNCIRLYQDKIVSAKFLEYWTNAYNWIIMGGFRGKASDETERTVTIDSILIWQISDWLDSLSFFDGDESFLTLDDYKKAFRSLDSIYRNYSKWKVFYSFTGEKYDDGTPVQDICILLANDKKRIYTCLYSDGCDFNEYVFENATLVENIDTVAAELKKRATRTGHFK